MSAEEAFLQQLAALRKGSAGPDSLPSPASFTVSPMTQPVDAASVASPIHSQTLSPSPLRGDVQLPSTAAGALGVRLPAAVQKLLTELSLRVAALEMRLEGSAAAFAEREQARLGRLAEGVVEFRSAVESSHCSTPSERHAATATEVERLVRDVEALQAAQAELRDEAKVLSERCVFFEDESDRRWGMLNLVAEKLVAVYHAVCPASPPSSAQEAALRAKLGSIILPTVSEVQTAAREAPPAPQTTCSAGDVPTPQQQQRHAGGGRRTEARSQTRRVGSESPSGRGKPAWCPSTLCDQRSRAARSVQGVKKQR